MTIHPRVRQLLFPIGVIAIILGTLDPMEGSVVILTGIGLVTFDAMASASANRALLGWALALCAAGVAALWILSALGGVRYKTDGPGLSPWWALLIVPYPIGWLLGVIGAFKGVMAGRTHSDI